MHLSLPAKTSNVSLGKYGTFKTKDLVDKPYGHTYEIVDGGLQVMQATLNEIGEFEAGALRSLR